MPVGPVLSTEGLISLPATSSYGCSTLTSFLPFQVYYGSLVILGLDWFAGFRDHLIGSNMQPPVSSTFDFDNYVATAIGKRPSLVPSLYIWYRLWLQRLKRRKMSKVSRLFYCMLVILIGYSKIDFPSKMYISLPGKNQKSTLILNVHRLLHLCPIIILYLSKPSVILFLPHMRWIPLKAQSSNRRGATMA